MKRNATEARPRMLALDRLVGRRVVDRDGRPAGRIQEFRVETRRGEWVIVEYVLGVGGLLERLNVGLELLFGARPKRRTAPADRVDISDPQKPRLTCRRDDLPEA